MKIVENIRHKNNGIVTAGIYIYVDKKIIDK